LPVALSTGAFGAFPRPPHPPLALIPAPRGTWSGVPGSRSVPLPAGPKVRAECGPSPRTPELPIPVLLPHSVRARPRPPARSGDDLRFPVPGPRSASRPMPQCFGIETAGAPGRRQPLPGKPLPGLPSAATPRRLPHGRRICPGLPPERAPTRSLRVPPFGAECQSRGLLAAGALSLESRFRWVSCTRTPPCHLGMSPIR